MCSKKIKDCSEIELDKVIIPAVTDAFNFTGKKNDQNLSDQLKFIYKNLPNELKSELPFMRINEIPIAIKKLIYKEFGDYYGINVAEIVRACKMHFESDIRVNTAKSIIQPIEPPKQIPTQEQQFYLFKNNCILAFEKFKTGGNFENMAVSCYDFFDKLHLIIFSNKEKFEFMETAAKSILSDNFLKMSIIFDDYKRRPYQRVNEAINKWLNDNVPVPEDVKILIIMKSKFITLKAFFEIMKDAEFSLSDLIDNKNNFL